MSSSSSNNINNLIREKLSPDEAVKLVELLDREVPVTRYAKFINEDTGEEVDINTALQQQQPRPTSCFEFFSDYMNCHVRDYIFSMTRCVIFCLLYLLLLCCNSGFCYL
jgi:hypothetical protein